ncbi:MAG: chemotaxis-specific protein-glutamate methyltransferase CheB [Gammaproteobacteria bacterium]|nr:chemotaxis-specific protein-glutamate methyltransferase CheB [Gammaproteobacteria bacterium]MCP5195350.1 chemotaxis-specific protein-glutamate methyltransferase CheB [Gammaproteobacteria bacterium]
MSDIKLLVVDDSALMRKHLVNLFQAEGGFEIRTCRTGLEALQELPRFQPDVVTLDINMPEMDGLTALSHIMVKHPCPVIMVSSLTEKGAMATFEALSMGAVDYICKPGGTISLSIETIHKELIAKVRTAARSKIRKSRGLAERIRQQNRMQDGIERQKPAVRPCRATAGVVVIGVSTGGPRTLEEILPRLPADFPWPVVVAQHMPANFTGPFSNRMGALCTMPVHEVTKPTPIEPGTIYIGRGGADVILGKRGTGISAVIQPENPNYLWHPSVELLARSALDHFPADQIVGVMLTGMGYDGADAMAEIRKRGGKTIAESEETAVVFGMPAELINRGGATVTAPCDQIAKHLLNWLR